MKCHFSRVVIFLLVFAVGFGPSAQAVQVRMRESLQFETLANGREATGILRAGSIVDIPDKYRVNDSSGRFSPDLTMNNWLQNAGRVGAYQPDREGGLFLNGSRGTLDYYYPVKILAAANGSTMPTSSGKSYFLAFRFLKQNQKKQLVTTADARITNADSSDYWDRANAIQAKPTCTNCQTRERNTSPQVNRLVGDLGPALRLAKARDTKNRYRTSEDMRTLSSEFRRSCGFSLESFIPVVKSHAARAGVPLTIMLSIMVQESSGHCFDVSTNSHNLTSDRGLFGVNSGTSKIRRCSSYEIQSIQQSSPQALAYNPQCIENPVINLDVSINILKSKLALLERGGFDDRRLRDANGRYTQDAWRMMVSAYNGGERWVLQARQDLLEFNHRQGTKLDPHHWEDLRIFYLRSFLNENRELSEFGSVKDGRTDTALLNLAYSENVVPRKPVASQGEFTPVANLWDERLQGR